jgi:hypothetical protein
MMFCFLFKDRGLTTTDSPHRAGILKCSHQQFAQIIISVNKITRD